MIVPRRSDAHYACCMRGTVARNVSLPRPMRDALISIAAERNCTVSEVIVAAVDAYLLSITDTWQRMRLP